MPRQIYCWPCCGLVCFSVLHVLVWNPPLFAGTPHKMSACFSVHDFYTPQILRPESSFFILKEKLVFQKNIKWNKRITVAALLCVCLCFCLSVSTNFLAATWVPNLELTGHIQTLSKSRSVKLKYSKKLFYMKIKKQNKC